MHKLLMKLLRRFSPPQHLRWRSILDVVSWCHKELYLKCQGGPMVCPCHYSYYYRYFSNWTSFKIHLIWAHLKFHYRLLFRSASATIPESKLSSSTFSPYPLALWQRMNKTYSWTHVVQILKGIQKLFELHEFSNYRSSDYFS